MLHHQSDICFYFSRFLLSLSGKAVINNVISHVVDFLMDLMSGVTHSE